MKNFIKMAAKIVRNEHAQMPKVCECGGDMKLIQQILTGGPVMGDTLVYMCDSCGFEKVKFFPFPEEYAKYFGGN